MDDFILVLRAKGEREESQFPPFVLKIMHILLPRNMISEEDNLITPAVVNRRVNKCDRRNKEPDKTTPRGFAPKFALN
jgi:hypothetical protein